MFARSSCDGGDGDDGDCSAGVLRFFLFRKLSSNNQSKPLEIQDVPKRILKPSMNTRGLASKLYLSLLKEMMRQNLQDEQSSLSQHLVLGESGG